jgi:hypothetical protein
MKKKVRQRFFQLIFAQNLFLVALIFVSCEGTQNAAVLPDETNTIKYATIVRASECDWIDNTEVSTNANAATISIQKTDDILNSIIDGNFSDLVEDSDFSTATPIYPSIEGFGSLDTTELSDELLKKIKTFISFVNSGNFKALQVSPQKDYLRALAKYRLKECAPVEESFIGKPLTTNDETSVPVLLKTISNQYILVLFYKKDGEDWNFNKFEVSMRLEEKNDIQTEEIVGEK